MFRPSPVGYVRFGVSAPRRELRESYVQKARKRHKGYPFHGLIPVTASDHATGVSSSGSIQVSALDHSLGHEFQQITPGIPLGATSRVGQSLARYQIGEPIGISFQCLGTLGPVQPDTVPTLRILSPTLTSRGDLVPPDVTDPDAIGLFRYRFTPGSRDQPGRYVALFTYATLGQPRCAIAVFEIVPGGHPSGAIVSQATIPAPDAIAFIAHADCGRILTGRGPYLDEGVD